MKVWIINPFDRLPGEPGAPGRYALLARALAEAGHTVVWWTSSFSHGRKVVRSVSDTTVSAQAEGGSSIDIRLVEARPYRRNVSIARIRNHREYASNLKRQLLREFDVAPPDVILCSLPPPGALAAVLSLRSRLGNARIVVDVQDVWPDSFRVLLPAGRMCDGVARILLAKTQRRVGAMLGSEIEATATCRSYLAWAHGMGAKGERSFYLATRRRASGREGEASAAGPVRFLYAGSMGKVYDLATLVEAAGLLKERGTPFAMTFVGGGGQEPRLRKRVRELGFDQEVSFRGFLAEPEFSQALAGADVGIIGMLPLSRVEMPNKATDYLSAALPILNCLPGELAQCIESARCGDFYTAGSPVSLAERMDAYARDRARIVKESNAASKLFAQSFDQKHVYPAMARWLTDERDE